MTKPSRNALLIVDVQKEFLTDTTRDRVPEIQRLTETGRYDCCILTYYKNTLQSPFYNRLHRYSGLDACSDSLLIHPPAGLPTVVEEKTTYGLPHQDLPRLVGQCSHIDLVGFDTDACVIASAITLFDEGYDFDVLGEYCASTNGRDYHEAGMKIINRVLARQLEPERQESGSDSAPTR